MTARRIFSALAALAFLVAFSAGSAMAMGSDDKKADMSANPDYAAGVKAIGEMRWDAAVTALSAALKDGMETADLHNYLGFAYRKQGKLEEAFRHYEVALTIDPEHRGVREYLGEAYLLAGDPAKAEEQLKKLDSLCLFGCAEYDQLKKAIADYRKTHPAG